MIAKNVGIRASKGEFILATNVDILFSNSLMEFISQKKLEIGKFYRVDRYDVPSEVPRATLDEKLSFCAYNSLRVSSKFGTYNLLTGEIEERIYQKANEGYPDYFVGLFGFFQIGSIIMKRLLLGTDSPDSSVLEKWPYFYVKSAAKRLPYFRNLIARAEVELMIFSPAVHLHTNACGDFTLMSRKDWIRVRGYGEFEMYSLHVDSLLLFNAYFLGAREVYLSYPIYHMDHSLGWARREPLLRDLSRRCVPYLSYEDFLWLVARMSLSDQKELNGENWGLAEYSLLEFSLGLTSHEPLLIPKSSIRT